jgi:hypothetical protein
MPKQLFYVFNGDADGIIATHQLRLMHGANRVPADAHAGDKLLTGVKRDISLLARLQSDYAATDWRNAEIFVCDISLDSNATPLYALLDQGATVHYFDHHRATLYQPHPRLHAHLDMAATTCTSLIVDAYLQHRFHAWAIAAAYGDGLQPAPAAAFTQTELTDLARLGRAINYNAYGDTIADLHYPPQTILDAIADFADPLAYSASSDMIARLESGANADLALLSQLVPEDISAHCQLWMLPDAPASRRANGTFANQVSAAAPHKVHAILTPALVSIGAKNEPQFSVSIRVPQNVQAEGESGGDAESEGAGLTNPTRENWCGADAVASQFATGGGRRAAAGINKLPASQISALHKALRAAYG